MPDQVKYDLESVKLPRLAGGLLNVFVSLLESPVTAKLLLGTFLNNAGVTKLRGLIVDEAPTLYPHHPVPDEIPGSPPDTTTFPDITVESKGFRFRTVRDYAETYRSGRCTPEEVAERALDAIERSEQLDPAMRVFIAVNHDDVLEQAQASTRRFQEGRPLSIFDGVPVAVKDEVDMIPYPTTVGTKFLGDAPALEDSTVVARMRAAGALLLGKANMHEIGISTSGLNPHHGTPRNPYQPDHYTGGSSSGPGAAVAIGFCPVAIGADGGGSIRIPSAFCGIVGLKATFGRVSEFGAAPLDWSVAHLGPMAATAEDTALAYAVLAGADPKDPHSLEQPPVTIDGFNSNDLTGLTLGIYRPWFEHATPPIVAACDRMVEAFRLMGAEVREIAIPELDPMRIAHSVTILSEMAANMDRYDAEYRRDFDPNTRVLLSIARSLTSRDYIQSQRIRTRTIRRLNAIFELVDVIVSPTTAINAPRIPLVALEGGESDASTTIETMRFVYQANLAGYPGISIPAGYDEDGLPIGLHAMGRPWAEHVLLKLAYAAQQAVERRKPQVYYDLLDG
jgi:Asp-tRNA(Asn)/Glu-tRNA(Gln) amidotransferase A subunit family amidase